MQRLRLISAWVVRRLGRVVSSNREYIPEVDGFRFLAIVPVMILHATSHMLIAQGWTAFPWTWTQTHGNVIKLIGAGGQGVQVFFVISGFVVSLPFARHALRGGAKPAIGRFFLRRVTRIEPPYLIALTVMYLVERNYHAYLVHYLAGLVYLHEWIFHARNPVNIVTWSLETEICFYLIAPLLTTVYYLRRRRLRWLLQGAVLMGISLGLHSRFFHGGALWFRDTIFANLPCFLAGILLADIYTDRKEHRVESYAGDLVALFGGGCVIAMTCTRLGRYFSWLPVAIMLLLAGGFQGRISGRFLRHRIFTTIGGMCYSLYLWHIAVLIFLSGPVSRILPTGLSIGESALLFNAIAVPILIVTIAPIFYFTEKPFMNGNGSLFLEKLLRRARVPAGSHASEASLFASGEE